MPPHDHAHALIVCCNGAAREAPTDGASVRLLETVREAEADSQCVFVSACRHSGGECLPPHDQAHALIEFHNGAACEAPNDGAIVRLLETVREADADSQCVFVSACRHSGGECLPPPDQAPANVVCRAPPPLPPRGHLTRSPASLPRQRDEHRCTLVYPSLALLFVNVYYYSLPAPAVNVYYYSAHGCTHISDSCSAARCPCAGP